MNKISLMLAIIFISAPGLPAFSQNWKLAKNQDGIAVYEGQAANSPYKSIKVECSFTGNFDRLIEVLSNVSQHKDWVYNNKTASLLKRVSPSEFYYYTETSLPWPMSNRDAVMHTIITRDSLDRFLKISSVAESGFSPKKKGKVRISRSAVSWYVTMPQPNSMRIVYTLEADPGGSIPAWLVNSFVDKGPYESFKKLRELLK